MGILILNPTIITKFRSLWCPLDNINLCWSWLGRKNDLGYGFIRIFVNKIRTVYFAHRVSYMIHNQIERLELNVLHECDNPECVNPYHLFLGTQVDNMKDMWNKKRGAVSGNHGNCTLLDSEIKQLKIDRRSLTYQELADKYRVSITTAWNIINGITCKSIKIDS